MTTKEPRRQRDVVVSQERRGLYRLWASIAPGLVDAPTLYMRPPPSNDRLQSRRWYYYVNVVQPDRTCIKLLKTVGLAIFYVEIARDFTDRTQDLYDEFKRYFVQPWRREAPVQYKGTVYGAPRNASINYVFYPKYSDRLKSHSLHVEARLNGRKVLERAGITGVSDLLYFNFNDYWERKLVLRKVNLDRRSASVHGGRR